MGIKEIINRERWALVGGFDFEVKRHNASLDRIESALENEIKRMERSAERDRINIVDAVWESKHIAIQACKKRIAELEQVLRWLDTQGGLGYEKHVEIKKVLGGDA